MGVARGRLPSLTDIALWRPKTESWEPARLLGGEEIFETHYLDGRGTMPHLDRPDGCPYCRPGDRIRTLAYLPCLRMKRDRTTGDLAPGRDLLEIPAVVFATIADRQPLRGRRIDVRRLGRNFEIRFREEQAQAQPGSAALAPTLTESFDPVTVLLRYWGLRPQDLEPPAPVADAGVDDAAAASPILQFRRRA